MTGFAETIEKMVLPPKVKRAIKIVVAVVAIPILAICSAVLLYFLFIAWAFIDMEWDYFKDEQKITERMQDVSFLEFDFCYEGKCFYTYADDETEISVSIYSVSKVDEVATKAEAVFADWKLAPSICSSLQVLEGSDREVCFVE